MSEAPSTIAELDEACQAFEIVDGDGNIERVGMLPANLTWWGHVFGGSLYDEETQTITANDPANVAALEWMAGLLVAPGSREGGSLHQRLWRLPEHAESLLRRQGRLQAGRRVVYPIPEEVRARPGDGHDCRGPTQMGDAPTAPPLAAASSPSPPASSTRTRPGKFIRWLSEDEHMGEFCFNIQEYPAQGRRGDG